MEARTGRERSRKRIDRCVRTVVDFVSRVDVTHAVGIGNEYLFNAPLRRQRDVLRDFRLEVKGRFTEVPAEEIIVLKLGICRYADRRTLFDPDRGHVFSVSRIKGHRDAFGQSEADIFRNPCLVIGDGQRVCISLYVGQCSHTVAHIGCNFFVVRAADDSTGDVGHRRSAGIVAAVHNKRVASRVAAVCVIGIRCRRAGRGERGTDDVQGTGLLVHRGRTGYGTGNRGGAGAWQIDRNAVRSQHRAAVNVDGGVFSGGTVRYYSKVAAAVDRAVHVQRLVLGLEQDAVAVNRYAFSDGDVVILSLYVDPQICVRIDFNLAALAFAAVNDSKGLVRACGSSPAKQDRAVICSRRDRMAVQIKSNIGC